MLRALALLCCLTLAACASLTGPAFTLQETTRNQVLARHGLPAIEWATAGGGKTLVWPSGPNGTWTVMAEFDARERLTRYENVLDREHFNAIQEGMSMDEVTRLIGPPYEPWTIYFAARDELVWEWRYCDGMGEVSRFNVLFDGTSKKVRSTLSLTEAQHFGGWRRSCGGLYLPLNKPAAP